MKNKNIKLFLLSLAISQSMFLTGSYANSLLSNKLQALKQLKVDSKMITQLPEQTRAQLIEINNKISSFKLDKQDQKITSNLIKQTEKAKKKSPDLFKFDVSTNTINLQKIQRNEEVDNNSIHNEATTQLDDTETNINETDELNNFNNNMKVMNVAVNSTRVQSVNLNDAPYFVKIYKNYMDDYQYFVQNNIDNTEGISFKFATNVNSGKNIVNDKITYDNKSPEVSFGIQNNIDNTLKISFDTMYKEQKYDLNHFKDAEDKMLFMSANIEKKTDFVNLNGGYIFANKLNSKINKSTNNDLYGTLDNKNHRFFASVGKNFEIYDNLYLSTNAGINFDVIGIKNFKINDQNGDLFTIKNKNNFLTTKTIDITLHKDIFFNNNIKLNIFAGTNFNYGNKNIHLTEKSGNEIATFKLKNYNYFIGGADLKLNDKFALKTVYKNNLSKTKDKQINFGLNMNI